MSTETPSPSGERVVQVAAAVVLKPDGRFLLAQRPRGKVYEGYWEFPGGKIERGESARAALDRELREELGIEVTRAYPWITRRYRYEHATVDLHFFRVTAFRGEPHARENQALAWQSIEAINVEPILPANGPILAGLALPPVYAITDATERGMGDFMAALRSALTSGLSLIQIREPQFDARQLRRFAREVVDLAHRARARVLVNAELDLAVETGADGVHLKASQLDALQARPDLALVGASCHDERELDRAWRLGVDFVVLGPVAPTASHPGAQVLGWPRLAALVRGYPLPVYALGGMRREDLERAWDAGAHGISMQRGAWPVGPRR